MDEKGNLFTHKDVFEDFQIHKYKRNQLILFQGEVPQFGFVLKKGVVKEYDISKQGNEQITWLVNELEIFPLPWLMDAVSAVTYYYETVSPCEVYILRKEEYHKLLKNNWQFLLNELKRQTYKENEQAKRLAAILNHKAQNKLLNTFQYLVENYGVINDKRFAAIKIRLTHQDIANLTGLTRETVSKELNILKELHIINQQGKRTEYIINMDMLGELVSTPLSNPYLSGLS